MLQAWLSIGYIVLLAILVLAFILWRRGTSVLAIAALVVGIPLWFGWESCTPNMDDWRHHRNGSAPQ
jgi:Na+/proline symporter